MSEQNVASRGFSVGDLASPETVQAIALTAAMSAAEASANLRRAADAARAVTDSLERAGRAVTALRGSFSPTRPQHEAAGRDTDYCYGTGARWSDLMSRIDNLAAEEAYRD
jgi:hypothetical protein